MFNSLFKTKKNAYYKVKTYTYYIPSPPSRKTGYQEKEFDGLIEYINSLGFELIDLKIESHSGEQRSGLWVICLLGAKTEDIYKTPILYDSNQINKKTYSHSDNDIPLNADIIHD
ncbi:MAG: hypothetical protein QF441_01435 [Bacteriovoracaceae bacterium]|nr:hypothetical protein [Halobacteriovoraceae bacterium]MDP7319234.1 hypothetical protein [Bacteriovoracaceae bacterium]